jgi:hypothetical protein
MSKTFRRATAAAFLMGFTLLVSGCGGGGMTSSGSRMSTAAVGNLQMPITEATPAPEPTPVPQPGSKPAGELTEITVICPVPVVEEKAGK